jgi:hypothetical protein
MPANEPHPKYDEFLRLWERLRDAAAGEDAVKEKGTLYLPVPPGLKNKGEKSPEYQNYKIRAKYPESVGPAIEGMAGLMSRKEMEVKLPEAMKYLEKLATSDGLDMAGLINRIRHEVLTVGRYVLLVDVQENGGNPYIATYPAESLINWRSDGDKLTMAVFYEQVNEPDPDDPYVMQEIDQWRVCRLQDGQYTVNVYRKDSKDESRLTLQSTTVPKRKGEPLDFVPVVIIGSRDLLPDPDAIPLLSIANKSLHYYRQYADYAMHLFMAANGTTPYAIGDYDVDKDAPQEIGPATIWAFGSANVKVGFIEISGNGIQAQKEELDNISQEIAYATVKVLGDKRAAEATETLRLRFQSQTATLASIAKAKASGLRQALQFAAEWLGVDPDKVEVDPSLEFIRELPDPQVINVLMNGVERGLMPHDILAEYMKQTEMHDMSIEDFLKLAPAALAMDAGGD